VGNISYGILDTPLQDWGKKLKLADAY